MSRIIAIFRSETLFFTRSINPNARRVISSNIMEGLASPLAQIFLGAFIWRITGSLAAVAIYKLGEAVFLPIAFSLNGFLLRRFPIQQTFLFGAIIAGASCALLVVLEPVGLMMLFLCGCIRGVGNGLYYGNRNFLELQETTAEMRQYFFSFVTATLMLADILVPFIAGWFIAAGALFGWYSPLHAYWLLFAIAFVLMLASGIFIARGTFESPVLVRIFCFRVSPFFNKRRLLQMTQGFIDNFGFLASVLVLYLFGNEGALGTVSALIACISALAVYGYGRVLGEVRRSITLVISVVAFLICALLLAAFHETAIIYILFSGIAATFLSLASYPIILGSIEEEMTDSERYSFIVDSEAFLNFGRILSIGVVLLICALSSVQTALFSSPVIVGVLCLLSLTFFFRVKRKSTNGA